MCAHSTVYTRGAGLEVAVVYVDCTETNAGSALAGVKPVVVVLGDVEVACVFVAVLVEVLVHFCEMWGAGNLRCRCDQSRSSCDDRGCRNWRG